MTDTFVKKTWETDDTITADELNRMENGIANATSNIVFLNYGEEYDVQGLIDNFDNINIMCVYRPSETVCVISTSVKVLTSGLQFTAKYGLTTYTIFASRSNNEWYVSQTESVDNND